MSSAELRRPSSFAQHAALLLLTLSLFGCDHATKLAAEGALSEGRVVNVVSGVLELRYQPNPDMAFSLLRTLGVPETRYLLMVGSAIALIGVVAAWFASRKRATVTKHIGFALVFAGALGNVVDRAVRGYVVDFIHITRWPIFNVADVVIVVGMLLLAYGALRQRAGDDPHAQAGPSRGS